ncbi:hypothetical protein [Chitinophaga qingshengii]|uniref:Lipoprotein n=1 Tax=Chitinophaga qingshengii TaxID=1569794 RepID=A0ABR7TZ08_9BACT|nr:hypothetical protein [Chitinophaga qingshengii]MBC9934826.1 hypothetical protein [Chitinophaga qingshengii]
MQRVFLSLLMLCATACHHPTTEDEPTAVPAPSEIALTSLEEEDSVQKTHEDIDWKEIEALPFSKALIDNKVPLHTTLPRFKAVLGEADSLVKPNMDYLCGTQFDDEFQYFYKDGSRYELHNDTLLCSEFRLTPEHSIVYKGITFSQATTWADMKKHFPRAVQQAENGGYTDMITLRDADVEDSDSSIHCYFEDGKLVRIVYFVPC